ncbi:FkbM family methyltransferase [Rhodoblastus acidophilus]|nr:FkbM family methyltransferase [Rhodoblastus acidophilus]
MDVGLDIRPVSGKAFARYLYAHAPGAAWLRFALKDIAAYCVAKPEFAGVRALSLGGLFVDVGANRGQSIAAFRRLAPGAEIVAFEPEPLCAALLLRRFGAVPRLALHACALGRDEGELSFFIPRYGRWDCDGMAATTREEATLWLRDPGRMFRFDESLLRVEDRRVACRKLDSFALSPDLIKVHAQGAELDILEGARETLRRTRPALMCAFPSADVVEFLGRLDYRPYAATRNGFAPGLAGGDATFTWFLPPARAETAGLA